LADGTIRMACINYLEGVVAKVPDAIGYLSEATGPAAPFEQPGRRPSGSRLGSAARTIRMAGRAAIG
ncbi:MAG TPA: hypothetical protein VFH20_02410, partial [Propionibacteriaceae bacterium]|nr:hypothetical protein [Propionibacteriaceae bacterium]